MIRKLRLQNFRSYTDKTFNLNPLTNIIVGSNATGKTNLLEAILVIRTGSSYRAKDVDLISFHKRFTRLDAEDDGHSRIVKIERDKTPHKTIEINSKVYKRLSSGTKLPVILFEPNHLRMLNGSPERRRAYLDGFISQLSAGYGLAIRQYIRALSQRNSLLKSPQKPTKEQLFPWNIRISQIGGQIVRYRQRLINMINENLSSIYTSLSGDGVKTLLIYNPQLPVMDYEELLLTKLDNNINDDLRSGFTAFGPHRDDFTFMFNNHPSISYASRGELRTAILSLKICELETIKKQSEYQPIILLDDVYSELDINRRTALNKYLTDTQSFITTTDADLVTKQMSLKSKIIKL